MPTKAWIRGLNRIKTKKNLPITLTGGEPTLYKGFYELIDGIDESIPIDLLTNGDFDVLKFIERIPPDRMKRKAKYASIRVSYHPYQTDIPRMFWDIRLLKMKDYSVGIWAVDTGDPLIKALKKHAKIMDIDFRTKELLGKKHGTYKYPKGVNGIRKKARCKPSELLIAPDGYLFRCHYDLYHRNNPYAHILDENVKLPTDFSSCNNYGLCSPCDLKLKFDRFQRRGHCSVTIKEIRAKSKA